MKPIFFILLNLLLLLGSCGDDDDSNNPVDQLPPLTNTGANTFGCLINGKAFTPQSNFGGGSSRGASYQFIFNGGVNSFFQFQVFGSRDDSNEGITINIKLASFDDLQTGETYELTVFDEGGRGLYFLNGDENSTTHTHRSAHSYILRL